MGGMLRKLIITAALVLVFGFGLTGAVQAQTASPHSGTVTFRPGVPFDKYVPALRGAIEQNNMIIIGIGCASCGARSLGVTIPGNRVFLFFNRYFATQVLEASTAAGIEAPIRIYVTEVGPDKEAEVTYRKPSHVFGAYPGAGLRRIGLHLNIAVDKILSDALRRANRT